MLGFFWDVDTLYGAFVLSSDVLQEQGLGTSCRMAEQYIQATQVILKCQLVNVYFK